MSDELDKKELYGNYLAGQKQQAEKQRWQNELAKEAAHMALDIPIRKDDDMNINAPKFNVTKGVGWMGLVGTALAAGLPPLIAAAILAWKLFFAAPAVLPTTPTPAPSNGTGGQAMQDMDAIVTWRWDDDAQKWITETKLVPHEEEK